MTGILSLSYQSITVNLSRFADANFPRERLEPLTAGQSRNGASLLNGPSYESKHIWNVSAIVPPADAALAQDISDLYQLLAGNVVVSDGIRPYTEPTPRTRPLVATTTATTIGSRVRYFAQFNALISGVTVNKLRLFEETYQVDFQLTELSKLTV